jgi:hypothetical protein
LEIYYCDDFEGDVIAGVDAHKHLLEGLATVLNPWNIG